MIDKKLKRIDDLEIQTDMPVSPSALANARAITKMLCALNISHHIYPTPDRGIQFEFEAQYPIEVECTSDGTIETWEFDE